MKTAGYDIYEDNDTTYEGPPHVLPFGFVFGMADSDICHLFEELPIMWGANDEIEI